MGKKDSVSGSLKAIANAAKSKGLQKLRWYCQVCAKQCRDENGFKCHCTSEAHLRQMEIFGMNQGKFVAEYSREFQRDFLNLLAISHRNSRVAATVIYNEYISNKTHMHMNSTRWTSLTGFIQHLGREGICEIDETPKGWFLIYRPEDKEEKMRQAMKAKRERAEEDEEERAARLIAEQIERANRNLPDSAKVAAAATELKRGDDDAHMKLSIANKRVKTDVGALALAGAAGDANALDVFKNAQRVASDAAAGLASKRAGAKPSALQEIMRRGIAAKEAHAATPNPNPGSDAAGTSGGSAGDDAPWLKRGIVVKVLSKALKGIGLYKKKGVVLATHDGGFVGEIEVIETGDRVRVDQTELETVLPSIGGRVLVLRGGAGVVNREAKLTGIDADAYKATAEMTDGPERGKTFAFDYEDVCKLSSSGPR